MASTQLGLARGGVATCCVPGIGRVGDEELGPEELQVVKKFDVKVARRTETRRQSVLIVGSLSKWIASAADAG